MSTELVHSVEYKRMHSPQGRIANGLGRTLSTVDTILLGRDVNVSIRTLDWYADPTTPNDPARDFNGTFIDYSNYSSNQSRFLVGGVDRRHRITLPGCHNGVHNDHVVSTLGYNYHAVGHYKFSPKNETVIDLLRAAPNSQDSVDIYKGVTDGHKVRNTFQTLERELYHVLECARVERLMIAAYPSTRAYFMASTLNRLSGILSTRHFTTVRDSATYLGAYLFLAARTYLASTVRYRALRELHKHVTYRIDDHAVTEALRTYTSGAYQASVGVKQWLETMMSPTLDKLMKSFTCHDSQKDFVEVLNTELASPCSMSMTYRNNGATASNEDQGELQNGYDDKTTEEGAEGSESDQDGSDDTDSQSDDPSVSAGRGSASEPSLDEMLKDEQKKATGKAMGDESSRREVDGIRSVIGSGFVSTTFDKYGTKAPDAEYRLMQKQMAREFGKIVEDADPGFVTYQPSGRVSMKRAMTGVDDYDTAFDQWDEGKLSASSMEVALLVDCSGSMHGSMDDVCQSMWAITKGIESLGDSANVTNFLFNSSSLVVKRAKDRMNSLVRTYKADGGTDPTTALADVEKLFSESNRVHKLCIILTDGVWAGTESATPDTDHEYRRNYSDADVAIASIQRSGGVVALAMMAGYRGAFYHNGYDFSHGTKIHSVINNPKDFVAFARSVVKEAMIGN